MRKFAKELAFVGRYHKLPAELERAALHFGGRAAVERAIEDALARFVFERDIRTQAEFRAYEAEIGRTLFEKGHALTQTAVRIVELSARLRAELAKVGGPVNASPNAKANVKAKTLSLYELSKLKERVVPEYLEAIAADLDRLAPKDFLSVYGPDRLARVPRYIEGLLVRLERARIAPDKDKAKAAQLERYAFELARLEAKSGTPYSFPISGAGPASVGPKDAAGNRGHSKTSPISEEKRAAVEELRWMIEEFKLALFAPEIKTAFPISAVRLARKIAEIEAMS